MMYAAILATLAAAAPTLATTPGAWFKFPTVPANGFETVSAKYWIDPSSNWTTGYYAATQWSFQGAWPDVQYFGLQPRSKGDGTTTGHLVYSVFGNGSRSKVVERGADGSRRWNGTFIDDQAGKRTPIASFWTDASYGGLSGSVSQWLEYYPFNGMSPLPSEHPCQPKFHIYYGKPNNYISQWTQDGSLEITAGIFS
ncbi:uncharacterized protein LOC62_01G001055 [Vanrija pseudolonga]|uniref:Uncharacterized protein n=1 Tax=Vanrija pseudolonga TaxID=143232 RepID=A0AAF0Y4F6_9TREE|nr:hypothetical protein LOC62_01G001055 [Vanrija pseudolonga]